MTDEYRVIGMVALTMLITGGIWKVFGLTEKHLVFLPTILFSTVVILGLIVMTVMGTW